MKNTVTDSDKLADKLDDDDKTTILDALEEHGDWLSSNFDADKDDFEDHLREL
jgi:heat shock protein 5